MTATGSRLSVQGNLAYRGCPDRSLPDTGRTVPHKAHSSASARPQDAQYQSCPRRWKDRSSFPHPAQHGAEIAWAPAARSATSSSATARGPGTVRRPAPRDVRPAPRPAAAPWRDGRRRRRSPSGPAPVPPQLAIVAGRRGGEQCQLGAVTAGPGGYRWRRPARAADQPRTVPAGPLDKH
jgi:hypothetical protein